MSVTNARLQQKGRTLTLLAGIRASEAAFIAFPSTCSRRSVASDESGIQFQARKLRTHSFVLPLRGQRRLEDLAPAHHDGVRGLNSLLLPVELRHVNHTASTNIEHSTCR
jgi:hypothetical protein